MSFNGSGVFQRLYSFVNDAAANIKIRADRMDNELNGFATGLSTCLTKDGQTTVTANLPMANYRHTGVGNATARTQYAAFGQVQDGNAAWVDGGGTADAITASYAIPITTLVDGQLCFVRATAANATTTPTFSPSSLTARTIVKNGGQALAAGDIAGDGHELVLRYDLTNTRWELLNPRGISIPFTAASSSGAASLQFAEDTDNGTNRVTLAAPAALAADRSITFPDAAGEITVLGNSTTGTGNIVRQTGASLTDPLITASGGALILPQSLAPLPTTDGDIRWDSDDNRLVVGDSVGQQIFYPVEQGTFTPTVRGTTLAGTGTYTINTGNYTRIGNRVWFDLRINQTAHTGTGNMELVLGTLPNLGATILPAVNGVFENVTSPASTIVQGLGAVGTNRIALYSVAIATGATAALAIDAVCNIYVSGSYSV